MSSTNGFFRPKSIFENARNWLKHCALLHQYMHMYIGPGIVTDLQSTCFRMPCYMSHVRTYICVWSFF
jgi:hypothetical protein